MPTSLSYPVRCGLALVSGLVYAAAYPPFGFGWLVVPGIAGLVIALRGQQGTRGRAIGFIHGMTAYAVSLSWLFQIFGWMTVMLWCVLAGFTALFAEMQCRSVNRGVAGWKLAIFTALNWCGWEFIRAELFPLKFPWMTAGLAMGPNSLLPWIGVYGVSAVVVLVAVFIAMRKWRAGLLSIVILSMAIWLRSNSPTPKTDDLSAVKVGGLQLESVSLTEFLKGTRELPSDLQYIVWPEYAVPFYLRANKRDWELIQTLCRERNITLTLGTQSRPVRTDGWRNIALTMDSSGVLGEHTKVHTVHFFDDGTAGTTALPVQTTYGKVGTPICFDCDYEGIVRKMTAAGAEIFVVPMMDARTWTARQHEQHAELFRIRACENGRWMFVCGTSGVSQIIDPGGRVQTRLGALKSGPIRGIMKRETNLTFYTRFGWLTPWFVLGIATICWLRLLLPLKGKNPTL